MDNKIEYLRDSYRYCALHSMLNRQLKASNDCIQHYAKLLLMLKNNTSNPVKDEIS